MSSTATETPTPDIHNGKFFFFYKSMLSNWHQKKFTVWDRTFVCGEQAMMNAKAALFRDTEALKKIMATTDPAEMQRIGRTVKNYNEEVWKSQREQIVYEFSLARFSQIDYLKKYLLSTDDAILVEASPIDKIWGIGLDIASAKVTPEEQWPGLKLLGKSSTRVKHTLRK